MTNRTEDGTQAGQGLPTDENQMNGPQNELVDIGAAPTGRDANGRFVQGHQSKGGRPLGAGPSARLANALAQWEAQQGAGAAKGFTMLGHYFATALVDPPTLRDLMSRIYPSLKAIEMKAEGLGTLTDAAREHVRAVLQARQGPPDPPAPPLIEQPPPPETMTPTNDAPVISPCTEPAPMPTPPTTTTTSTAHSAHDADGHSPLETQHGQHSDAE